MVTIDGGLRTKGIYKSGLGPSRLVSVVTTVYNGRDYIEETILSILNQTYSNIEYIIIDGGSTDGTVEIIKKYEDKIDYWRSEPDKGMYDGLFKGLSIVRGEIVGYCNAGDYYHKTAIGLVAQILNNTKIHWLTGMRINYNNASQVIHCDTPNVYRRPFIRSGVYGRWMPYIQQESTFWLKDAMDQIDWEYFRSLKLAGDYYLWYNFAKKFDLYIVNSFLGGFKYHNNQLSIAIDRYNLEKNRFVDRLNPLYLPVMFLDAFTWYMPLAIKKIVNPKRLLIYNRANNVWE